MGHARDHQFATDRRPLIEICDSLLVAGVINKKDELQFLLSLLNPNTFQSPPGECGGSSSTGTHSLYVH